MSTQTLIGTRLTRAHAERLAAGSAAPVAQARPAATASATSLTCCLGEVGVHRDGEVLRRRRVGHGEVAELVAVVGEGRLQLQRRRVVRGAVDLALLAARRRWRRARGCRST